ncbi:hypothetical protein ACFXP3_02535 [Streptomyces sp. NPDC059096]|uniref:hypothetical protein n=1 Tax=unclassified Streptomyces TaxID=2593676 RepID=UPI003676D9DB
MTTVTAGAIVLISAGGATAAPVSAPERERTAATAVPQNAYRGVQGANFCLLSRCTVGDSGSGGSAGPSNTQGVNFCLLALCTVRP